VKMKRSIEVITDRTIIQPGDTLNIYQKGYSKFSGVVLAKRGKKNPSASFTVRAILSGVAVEKIYPLFSPLITKIERLKKAKTRRAKLYYLREKIGKELKLKEKIETKPISTKKKTDS